MRNLKGREGKQLPQDLIDCRLWSSDMSSHLSVSEVPHIYLWTMPTAFKREKTERYKCLAQTNCEWRSFRHRWEKCLWWLPEEIHQVPQDVAVHSAFRMLIPAVHLACALARFKAQLVTFSSCSCRLNVCTQSGLTRWDPMEPARLLCPWNLPG